MRNTILLVLTCLLSYGAAVAQPYQHLGRTNPFSRFFYERNVPNTSVDVGILRERSMRWLQRELGTRGFDSATVQSPDTIRTFGYMPLRAGDGLRDIAATFRLRVMPSNAGIYFIADNFMLRASDAVNGERYSIAFEDAMDYFEGNSLSRTRQQFDDKFEKAIQAFDRLTVEPAQPANPDGSSTTGGVNTQ